MKIFFSFLKFLYKIWLKIGAVLGRINACLLLGLVFYVVVAPMGIIRRWAKGDFLRRRFDPDAVTYRVLSQRTDKTQMERPF